MRQRILYFGTVALGAALALAACSDQSSPEGMYDRPEATADAEMASADMAVEEAAGSGAGATASEIAARPEIPVSLPKIAYVYNLGFRMEGEAISALQQKHADMCAAMGPYSCQIVSMSHSGGEADFVTGSLELAVAADKARDFGKKLSASVSEAGGEEIASTISGEDLSKAIVDTEARLRSRVVLRDRLLEVLQTRRGKVSELVEAERSVAAVNEEIDRARSWLEEMRGRVAYSRVSVSYESAGMTSSGFMAPIRSALSSLGGIMGTLVATLILLLAIGGPIAALVWGVLHAKRRLSAARLQEA